jgi:ABC-type multidrug transport system ATPase subunit
MSVDCPSLLQGGSGAGKTTLMDVIAGRKTAGRVTGDIRVTGLQLKQSHFQGLIGYVSI